MLDEEQLARENPWYFARLYEDDPTEIDQIIATGHAIAGAMNAALDQVKAQLDLSRRDRRLARRVTAIAEDVGGESRAARGLADTLDALAARLRG